MREQEMPVLHQKQHQLNMKKKNKFDNQIHKFGINSKNQQHINSNHLSFQETIQKTDKLVSTIDMAKYALPYGNLISTQLVIQIPKNYQEHVNTGNNLLVEVTNAMGATMLLAIINNIINNNIFSISFWFVSKGLPTLSKLKTTWAKLKKYKYQEAGNKYVIQKLFGIIMYPKGKGKKKYL